MSDPLDDHIDRYVVRKVGLAKVIYDNKLHIVYQTIAKDAANLCEVLNTQDKQINFLLVEVAVTKMEAIANG
jgi:hypothetical protein